MSEKREFYRVGELVNDEGWYICVPCGYRKLYKRGEEVVECISCLEAHKDVALSDITDEGSWEKIGE